MYLAACAQSPPPEGLESLRAPAGVLVVHRVDTYPITGSDRRAMRAQLRVPADAAAGLDQSQASNANRFAGLYVWQMSWRYETQSAGGLCNVSKATVTLRSTVTIPEWIPPAGVDSALAADWPRYRNALAAHEQGHRELAYKGAGRLRRALEGVPMQSCGSIATATKTVGESVMKELRLEQSAYDRDTRHGITQGATW